MEKEAILNSYKVFFKTFNSDIQIVIQSKKEDLSKHISCVKSQQKNEKENVKKIADNYISYITELNKNKKSSTKNFYLIIKSNCENKDIDNIEYLSCQQLNEDFHKIKDCLSRCGNKVLELDSKNEINNVLFSFFNSQKFIFE